MTNIRSFFLFFAALVVLAGCQSMEIAAISQNISDAAKKTFSLNSKQASAEKETVILLPEVLATSVASVDVNKGFDNAIKTAVESDPSVLAARGEYEQRLASTRITASQKEFQVSGTAYGGVEDVTDETAGLALVLNANRLLFDGGQIENQISADELAAKSALNNFRTRAEEKALEALSVWVELERYKELESLINARLSVLDPLISQLEEVAAAGIGDVSQVAAAQRTVSMIRVAQTDVEERLEQSKVNFMNVFGMLPTSTMYNAAKVSKAVPELVNSEIVMGSPALKAQYAAYQAAFSVLKAVEARDSYTVVFESKLQRPLGNSTYDSDESVGLVVRKTLFNGNKLKPEIDKARANAATQLEILKSTYRQGKRLVDNAQQTIISMDRAIQIAKENAENAREEIRYLRKQLVIGQSTLDSVLSAEARLYGAESKEIDFLADRRAAELRILSALGRLSQLFNLK